MFIPDSMQIVHLFFGEYKYFIFKLCGSWLAIKFSAGAQLKTLRIYPHTKQSEEIVATIAIDVFRQRPLYDTTTPYIYCKFLK
jgi:hypothetical protein